MRVLVTGATGTNGVLIVKELVRCGAQVRALVRDPGKAAGVLPSGVELARGDLGDAGSLRAALQGVERALVLTPVDPRLGALECDMVRLCSEAKLAHTVLFSAIGAHPAHPAFFSRTHGAAEAELARSGCAYTILQPAFFMQNLLGLAPVIRATGSIFNSAGAGEAGHIDAGDIARSAAAVLTAPVERHAGQIYILTGPERLSYSAIAGMIAKVAGISVRHLSLNDEEYVRMLTGQAGLPEWLARAILELDVRSRSGDFSMLTESVEKLTGSPPRKLEDFLREHRSVFSA